MEESKGAEESAEGEVYIDDSGNLRRTQRCSTAPSTWLDHVILYFMGNGAMQAWKGVTPEWSEIKYAEYKRDDV